jgi:hypothetical protein
MADPNRFQGRRAVVTGGASGSLPVARAGRGLRRVEGLGAEVPDADPGALGDEPGGIEKLGSQRQDVVSWRRGEA